MASSDPLGAIAGAGEPALIPGNMDAAQRRVEMGRAPRHLGPHQARGDEHQRLQTQGDASKCNTQRSRTSPGRGSARPPSSESRVQPQGEVSLQTCCTCSGGSLPIQFLIVAYDGSAAADIVHFGRHHDHELHAGCLWWGPLTGMAKAPEMACMTYLNA